MEGLVDTIGLLKKYAMLKKARRLFHFHSAKMCATLKNVAVSDTAGWRTIMASCEALLESL